MKSEDTMGSHPELEPFAGFREGEMCEVPLDQSFYDFHSFISEIDYYYYRVHRAVFYR